METIIMHTMTSNELDQMLNEWYGPQFADFESVAEFEWNNYSSYSVEVGPNEALVGEEPNKWSEWKATGKRPLYLGYHQLLQGMYEDGILEAGHYLVEVFW